MEHSSASNGLGAIEVGGGIRLYGQVEGTGQTVVLVHGLVQDFRAWNHQITFLSGRYRTVAYSRRFASPNENPGDIHDDTVENNSTDLLGLIKNLNVAPIHLVGHSYGGLISAHLAYKHPELLRSLTLVEPAVYSALIENPRSTIQRLRFLLSHPSVALNAINFESNVQNEALNALKQGDPKSAVRILVDGVESKSGAFEQRFSEDFRKMAVENASSIYALETNLYRPNKREIAQIKVPTLIVRGENTRKSSRYISDLLPKLLSNSTRVVITRSGHFVHTENPEEFNNRLLEFLAKNSQELDRKDLPKQVS